MSQIINEGIRPISKVRMLPPKAWYQRWPVGSMLILAVIVLGCCLNSLIITKDPAYMDLIHYTKSPCREILFGTDTLRRDIFSMIWYGGRISLLVVIPGLFLVVTLVCLTNIGNYLRKNVNRKERTL